jgi:hypothetical protein
VSDDIRRLRALSGPAAAGLIGALVLATAAGGQGAPEPCPPGVPPGTSIRGFDVEDGGGLLTATHTISLDVRDRDGVIPYATFTLPAGATNRGGADNSAFSLDRPGPVTISATWSHYRDDQGTDCTATVQRVLQLAKPRRPIRIEGPGRTTMTTDGFQSALRAGRNDDRRPVQLRLRGTRHARLPGPGARTQKLTLAFRRGDPGLGFDGRHRILRAAGWVFHIGLATANTGLLGISNPDDRRRQAFGFELVFRQAGHRIGRITAVGHCGELGCRFRTGP